MKSPEKTGRKQAAVKNRGQWPKGRSGNPAGRRPGTGRITELRDAIAARLPSILEVLLNRAEQGDIQAIRLALERVVPPLRASEETVSLPLSGETLTQQGAAIFEAVMAGRLAASQGQAMISALDSLARLRESDEFERRLSRLEGLEDDT